jgi:broad specificity phosphatase PhoE
MPKLLLIRHAMPVIEPGVPANKWRLSEEGQAACQQLTPIIEPYLPAVFLSSNEPKAHETAAILASQFKQQATMEAGLHEHDRTNAPYFDTQDAFKAAVRRSLETPDQLVLGNEAANEALGRFDAAIRRIIFQHSEKNLVIGTHGTVMALFVAKYNTVPIVEFWQSLRMPDVVVLSLPNFILEGVGNGAI